MINPCQCGHEKGDHQMRIGQHGNYTPCCTSGCKCDAYARRGSLLQLQGEQAMCLDTELTDGDRTAGVQVNVSYIDQDGNAWHASRIVKMRLKKDRAQILAAPPAVQPRHGDE